MLDIERRVFSESPYFESSLINQAVKSEDAPIHQWIEDMIRDRVVYFASQEAKFQPSQKTWSNDGPSYRSSKKNK